MINKISAERSSEMKPSRRKQKDTFKKLKEKRNYEPRLHYLVKITFKNKGKNKNILDKQKLRSFVFGSLHYEKSKKTFAGEERPQGLEDQFQAPGSQFCVILHYYSGCVGSFCPTGFATLAPWSLLRERQR